MQVECVDGVCSNADRLISTVNLQWSQNGTRDLASNACFTSSSTATCDYLAFDLQDRQFLPVSGHTTACKRDISLFKSHQSATQAKV